MREGDEIKARRIEHQFDAHQDRDGVLASVDRVNAVTEDRRGYGLKGVETHRHDCPPPLLPTVSSRRAMTIAPIKDASRRIEISSNGSRYFVKSASPIAAVV